MRTELSCVASLILASSVLAAGAGDVVKIDSGALKGVDDGTVVAFKGIPYAAPPVGNLRWRAPQPAAPWSGVRSAAEYGSDCMQLPFPGDAAPLGTPPAEDCLVLNVWTPSHASGKKLPVMVWIYGGGFVNGGSSPSVYDGTQFAKRGIVFVSFNYRLGRFGFFAHPALTKESPSGPLGNYGYMDQIAALEWVRRNVAAFGGDPAQVTLFGESAGGGSVLTLMTSPLSRGLFHRAVIESGGGRRGLFPARHVREDAPGAPSGESVGVEFAKSVGVTGDDAAALAALRKLPADAVVAGLNMATMRTPTYPGPMIDGALAVETPEDAFRAGHQMKIPVMVGANSADIGFSFAKSMEEVLAPFGANAEKARAAYDPDGAGEVRKVGTAISADRIMVEPARFVARMVAASGQAAYVYRFSYVAESMRKEWPGAPHATEIPYVFDTVAAKYGKDLTPADEATAQAANAYWADFAKTGNPNGDGRPAWPVCDSKCDGLLDFTAAGPKAGPDPWKARLDLIEGLASATP